MLINIEQNICSSQTAYFKPWPDFWRQMSIFELFFLKHFLIIVLSITHQSRSTEISIVFSAFHFNADQGLSNVLIANATSCHMKRFTFILAQLKLLVVNVSRDSNQW